MNTLPDGVLLRGGAHKENTGYEMCVMEAVAVSQKGK